MKRLLLFIGFGLLFSSAANAADKASDGEAIFNRNCSVCHSVNPPPKAAPPIIPIASRYHSIFKTKAEGVKHMVTFLKAPSAQNAVGDPQAITRFGLMPPLALPESELRTVAEWVWDQYDPSMGTFRGQGQGRGRGQGGCR